MNRRHPLPWTMPDRGWIHLEPDTDYDNEPRPYNLRLGSAGVREGSLAALSAADLRQLRDQIDAILHARYRVLVLGGHGVPEPALADALHRRLDTLRSWHPAIEVAVLDVDSLDGPAITWCMATQAPVLIYPTVAAMVADGGNRALIGRLAGEGNQTPNWAAHVAVFRARVAYDWLTIDPAEVSS
jgi:hypothetical protein